MRMKNLKKVDKWVPVYCKIVVELVVVNDVMSFELVYVYKNDSELRCCVSPVYILYNLSNLIVKEREKSKIYHGYK